jgi:protease I
MDEKILSGRKILMVIAFKDFRDEEYFVPKEILEESGAEVKTASSKTGYALGADGSETAVDYLVQDVDLNNFDAVVFVGGPGCLANLDNENSYNLAREVVAKNKILAAICVSPVILAKAGVLQGKSATVWSSPLDNEAVKILQDNGAIYKSQDVVTDGKIITANGPDAAKEFADTLVENLR